MTNGVVFNKSKVIGRAITRRTVAAVSFALMSLPLQSKAADSHVTVGSKAFTEGYLLGEVIAQTIEVAPAPVTVIRKFGMGQTGVLFEALKSGEIDLYPEYTGTISEAILKNPKLTDFDDIQKALAPLGLFMSRPLGFNNTYALAVDKEFAEKNGLKTISDLARKSPSARVGFSSEFMSRADGYSALTKRYGFKFAATPQSMEHSLAYQAIENHKVDVVDAYSTDAKIDKLGLVVLEDDLHFFPTYEAVILARLKFLDEQAKIWKVLQSLEMSIDETSMRKMNAAVDIDKKSFHTAVNDYRGVEAKDETLLKAFEWRQNRDRIWMRTKEHLFLVGVALFFSILIGIPLGILATKHKAMGQSILLLSGTIQTIPSLALLCFLVPFSGIGTTSALIALCLYGLLPVVMNTFIGLQSIDPQLIEMSKALKLTAWQTLVRIRLPLASRNILAGIRTSAVIGIGTATLAALIGAGGYGAIIVSGLAINDTHLILMGAIPAALMALVAHGLFEILGAVVVPEGLR
jgi:osmoprotectant transport system permease protein